MACSTHAPAYTDCVDTRVPACMPICAPACRVRVCKPACTCVCVPLDTHLAHTCRHSHVTRTRLRAPSYGLELGKNTAPRRSLEPLFSVSQFEPVKAKTDLPHIVGAWLPIPSPGGKVLPLPTCLCPAPCPSPGLALLKSLSQPLLGVGVADVNSFPLCSQEPAHHRPQA